MTINASEPVYRGFQRDAETTDHSISELIREAMEDCRDRMLRRRSSLPSLPTYSLGRIRLDLRNPDELFGEMLGGQAVIGLDTSFLAALCVREHAAHDTDVLLN